MGFNIERTFRKVTKGIVNIRIDFGENLIYYLITLGVGIAIGRYLCAFL